MALGDWLIGVFMHFGTNGVETMSRLRSSVEAVNDRIKVQNGLIDKNAALMALQRRRVEELRSAQLRTAGNVAGGTAIAGGVALGFSVKEAADLQQNLTRFQMATGANASQMARIRQQVFDTARMTAQSAGTVAGQFVTISQMGLPSNLMTPRVLDQMAKFADVVNLQTRGQLSTDDALKIGISTAHQLGIYDAPGIINALTAQARTSFILPHGLQKFSTQAKYYAPWVRLFGDSPENIMSVMALANLIDVSGLSTGRGGTSVRALMAKLVPSLQVTKHAQSGQQAILKSMGLLRPDGTPTSVLLDTQGRTYFDPSALASGLYTYANSQLAGKSGPALIAARSHLVGQLSGLFGAQGGLFASILSTTGMAQLKNFHDRYAKTPKSIDDMQAQLLNTFYGSLQKATTAIDRFAAAFGTPALGNLTKLLTAFANFLDPITMNMVKHPRMTGYGFAGAAIGTGILGGFSIFVMLKNAFGALHAIRGIPESIEELGNALKNVGNPVKAVTGLVDQWGRPLSSVVNQAAKLAPEIGEGAGLAGRLGLLFTATSRVLGPIGILVTAIQAIAENVQYFQKFGFGSNFKPNASNVDPFNKVYGGGIPSVPRSVVRGPFGGPAAPPTNVHLHGNVSVVLPKGTPKQHAQAIIQHLIGMGASANTGPTIPGALTIGGGLAAYT